MRDATTRSRILVRVEGIVQGVGFRPFVAGLASDLGLGGHVGNDAAGVFIEVEGSEAALRTFLERLSAEAPALAAIECVSTSRLPVAGTAIFAITASLDGDRRRTLISPDVATCDACLAEMRDPTDRRYRYPFTNCTNCGPRYTIVRDVPYDRAATTMATFAMCPDCQREYEDPADRRFHAQPLCCPACGPRLELHAMGKGTFQAGVLRVEELDRAVVRRDPMTVAAAMLRAGSVVAIKGLGGYHLAALASDETAVASLRSRKRREEKPFAVMVADLESARGLCTVDEAAASLLVDRARPIVLLPRRKGARSHVAKSVAQSNCSLGLMLPYSPLHHLLLDAVGEPIVLTSGNVSDEPIAYLDDDASTRLAPIAEAMLTHDRAIHIRTDDSVVRVIAGRPMPLRRSRGFAPAPISVAWPFPDHVLAVGAELKNTICVAQGRHAFLSHHIGDLENYETYVSFTEAIDHLQRLFDVHPAVVAHDLHPEYLSTKHALDMLGVQHVAVQHHHAHVAACLADNGESGPVIGVAFDGTGFGADGTIWGGEVLVADLVGFQRVGHLDPVPLPGGTAAIHEPWRMAAAYLSAAFGDSLPDLSVRQRNAERWDDVLAVAAAGINSPLTSSAGRLFDAVSALLSVRDTVSYEGQAAIELEQLADPAEHGALPVDVSDGWPARIRGVDLVRGTVEALQRGVEPPVIAARFMSGLACAVAAVCGRVRQDRGLDMVALSGGVFQNVLFTQRVLEELEKTGFRVLTHRQVPPNDGGISLGQAVVAAARQRTER